MLYNFIKVGLRNILKYKLFSFINIFGLALGMSVCMLIILMVIDQKNYDQYHPFKDRTYRILTKRQESSKPNASSPFPLAELLKAEYPFVQEATTISLGVGGDLTVGEKSTEARGFFAQPSFFDVFGFELKAGDRATALNDPNAIILTEQFAHLVFGDQDPMGQTVQFSDRGLDIISLSSNDNASVEWGNFIVAGTIADKNYKSHLKFDVLISTSTMEVLEADKKLESVRNDWLTYSRAFTYVVLKENSTEFALEQSLNNVAESRYKGNEEMKGFRLIPQHLLSITPGIFIGNPTSLSLPIEVYYFLTGLAIVILLSACLNYVNLSTARSLMRAKEIGVRKVSGAVRGSLVLQFLSESVITALLALILACAILFLFLKTAFLNLWVNQYLLLDLTPNAVVFVIFILLALAIGVFAGIYPALRVSGHSPVLALKGSDEKRLGGLKGALKKILSTAQFAVSLFFIITSIVIYQQFRHFIDFKYEFESENIVNVALQGNKFQIVFNELSNVRGVEGASGCSFVPATGMAHGTSIRKARTQDEFIHAEIIDVHENFLSNLDLKLVAGDNITTDDAKQLVIVNVAAAEILGYKNPTSILGQLIENGGQSVQVAGVVENFRFQSPMMADKIGPLVMRNRPEKFDFVTLRLNHRDVAETLSELESHWKAIDPVHTLKYEFFDEQLKNSNRAMGDIVAIIGFISFIAVVIACLGLLGMITNSMSRREKEISIRKVLGANDTKIMILLSREFFFLLMIAVALAVPLSYLFNTALLDSLPNRIQFGPWPILFGCLVLLMLGCGTIASQTIKASRKQPAEVLKTE